MAGPPAIGVEPVDPTVGQALQVDVAREELLREQERHGDVVVKRAAGGVSAEDVANATGKFRQDGRRLAEELGGHA
jgi:hypothetical protein